MASNNNSIINLPDNNRSDYLQDNQKNSQINPQKKLLPKTLNFQLEKNDNTLEKEPKDITISKKTITEELEKANQQIWLVNKGLQFNLHEETNRTYVKIINKDNDEVIKEIPPSELLDVLAKIRTNIGILMDKKI